MICMMMSVQTLRINFRLLNGYFHRRCVFPYLCIPLIVFGSVCLPIAVVLIKVANACVLEDAVLAS